MTQQLFFPTHHFTQRLGKRFSMKYEQLDLQTFKIVTYFSSKRFDYPKIMNKIKKYGTEIHYLVNDELGMFIPVNERGSLITTLEL